MQTVQQTVKILQVQFLVWLTRPLMYRDRCRGSDSTEFRGGSAVAVAASVHRQGLHCLRGFCCSLWHFSHSVHMDVSAHFSALDGDEFFVVEGSGWRRRQFGACIGVSWINTIVILHRPHHHHQRNRTRVFPVP